MGTAVATSAFPSATLGSSGGGSVAGADTNVQFNDGGAFGGDAAFTFVKATGALSATSFTGAGTGLTGTAASLTAGANYMRAFATDALAPAFGAAVAGGGAVIIPVYYDGTSWKVG